MSDSTYIASFDDCQLLGVPESPLTPKHPPLTLDVGRRLHAAILSGATLAEAAERCGVTEYVASVVDGLILRDRSIIAKEWPKDVDERESYRRKRYGARGH